MIDQRIHSAPWQLPLGWQLESAECSRDTWSTRIYPYAKRTFDFVMALSLLILLAPLMACLLYTSPSPRD